MANRKWDNTFYVRAFRLARDRHTDKQIAQALGVSSETFSAWKGDDAALQDALTQGREGQGQSQLSDYVYDRLSPDLQDLWDRIHIADKTKNGFERVKALLADRGKTVRQQLFIYALVNGRFDPSSACRAVAIRWKEFEQWCVEDPEFHELMDEIMIHKKNWAEGLVYNGAAEGDTALIITLNKALNKDRGYGDTKHVTKQVTGSVEHSHAHVHFSAKDLIQYANPEQRAKLAEAARIINQLKVLASGERPPLTGHHGAIPARQLNPVPGVQDSQSQGPGRADMGEGGG